MMNSAASRSSLSASSRISSDWVYAPIMASGNSNNSDMAKRPINVERAAPTQSAMRTPCAFRAPIAWPMRVAMALPTLIIGI